MSGNYEFLCNMYGLSGTSGTLKYIICKMYLSFISKDDIAVYGVT